MLGITNEHLSIYAWYVNHPYIYLSMPDDLEQHALLRQFSWEVLQSDLSCHPSNRQGNSHWLAVNTDLIAPIHWHSSSPNIIINNNNRAIRVKIAVLLSSIAERTYPQLWPTMVDDFIHTWIHSTLPRSYTILWWWWWWWWWCSTMVMMWCYESDDGNEDEDDHHFILLYLLWW